MLSRPYEAERARAWAETETDPARLVEAAIARSQLYSGMPNVLYALDRDAYAGMRHELERRCEDESRGVYYGAQGTALEWAVCLVLMRDDD